MKRIETKNHKVVEHEKLTYRVQNVRKIGEHEEMAVDLGKVKSRLASGRIICKT